MAALSNELQVGVGDYAISDSDTATTLTLYSHQTRTHTVSHEVSDDLTVGTSASVTAHTSTTRSDTFETDYSDILGKYLKSGTSWYKIKSKPTKSATSPVINYATAESLTLFVTGNPDTTTTLTIADSATATTGEFTLVNKQFVNKCYNDDLTTLNGKVGLINSKYYSLVSVTKSATSTSEVIGTRTQEEYTPYGPNSPWTITYASGWSYSDRGIGYISETNEVAMKDYDSSSIGGFGHSMLGTYKNLEYSYYDEYKEAYVLVTKPFKATSYEVTVDGLGQDTLRITYTEVTTVPESSFTITASAQEMTITADSYLITIPGYLATAEISGYKYTFTNADIVTLEGEKAVSIEGDELSIDTLTPEIEYEYVDRLNFSPSDYDGVETDDSLVLCGYYTDDISEVKYGSIVKYYNNGNFMGDYYVKNIRQSKEKQYTINAMSFIGLLDKKYHAGGIYIAERFDNILGDIIGSLSDVVIEDEVASTTLTGYLPYDTARNNLHQLLFATGAIILRSEEGKLVFTYPLPNASVNVISTNNIFDDGEIEYLEPCSKIELTEYTYQMLDDTTASSLYDNSDKPSVTNKKVTFSSPVDPLSFRIKAGSVEVEFAKFLRKLSAEGSYSFSYTGGKWYYNSAEVTMTDYGFTIDSESEVTGISLNKSSTSIITGNTTTLIATLSPESAIGTVTWESDNVSIATVDSSGVVTAVAAGTTSIVATCNSQTATCSVTVASSIEVTGISLDKSTLSMMIDGTCTLTATLSPDGAPGTPTWYSSNGTIATVNSNGLITGISAGTATIIASYGTYNASCVVTVYESITVTGITLNKSSMVLATGTTETLKATLQLEGAIGTVEWSSSDTTKATVSDAGLVTGIVPGSATITAKCGNYAATCKVTIKGDLNTIIVILGTTRSIDVMVGSSTETFSYDTSKSNCNYATVSGRGILSAKQYTESTNVIEKDNPDAQEEYQENVVTSSDVTLISAANSENVATRLLNYNKALRKATINIKVNKEHCGAMYGFTNMFRRYMTGYLTKMSFHLSSFIKSSCEFLCDYTPSNSGNNFDSSVILTKAKETELSGVWTSPKTGTIRAILIAGGNGGYSGYAGEGAEGDGYGGEGGSAGTKGNGGKILTVTSISVTEGQQISFHVGSGCEGGAACDSHTVNNGPASSEVVHQARDGVTTFGTYTTNCSEALPSSTGVMDVFTGVVYGLPGSAGCAGGNGGAAGSSNTLTSLSEAGHYYSKASKSESGDSVVYHSVTTLGGNGVKNILPEDLKELLENNDNSDPLVTLMISYGWDNNGTIPSTGGGGASAGSPGGDGNSFDKSTFSSKLNNYDDGTKMYLYADAYATYGLTGKGGDGVARGTAATYGSGGSGGHGGGGEGGAPSTSFDSQNLHNYSDSANIIQANLYLTRPSGYGTRYGKGGAGGNGADGCILLYL